MEASRPDDVLLLLQQRQRSHPPLSRFPSAAQIYNLPLFIGDANAAQDAAFLESNDISCVVSLGTGKISPDTCEVLLVDILDMEDKLILPHVHECITFVKDRIQLQQKPVLVHCVFGQSRSAAICVAYLMATAQMTLMQAYDAVQRARPCIHINPGFLRQLELFERMQADPDPSGATPAHAVFRTLLVMDERARNGGANVMGIPQPSGKNYRCRKCGFVVCSSTNQVMHLNSYTLSYGVNALTCNALFVEPMQWMDQMHPGSAFAFTREGKLSCPSCNSKIGSWNWMGQKPMGNELSTIRSGDPVSDDIRLVARSISAISLPQLVKETERCFTWELSQFTRLLESLLGDEQLESQRRQTMEAVFRVFENKQRGCSDACETLAGLVLAAAHFSIEFKEQVFFSMFNVAMHRKEQMTADEAILLCRTVAMAASKMTCSLSADTPSTVYFENLVKALYGELEVLSVAEFSTACQASTVITAFLAQWPHQ